MASIQQSLNALMGSALGAATVGSYMYRQTPGFQAKQIEKGVDKINKQFALHGNNTIEQATPEDRARLLQAGEKGVELREKAFEMAPTAKRLENITKAEGSLKTLKQGVAEAEEQEAINQQLQEEAEAHMQEQAFESSITPKEKAEGNAINRLAAATQAQITQRDALKDRFEFLKSFSAKERAQFESAYNRHKNKGEID